MSYAQKIYNRLRQNGLTEAAALGFLGNWDQESGNEPNRLQGDFNPYRTASKAYVQGITNGTISKQQMSQDQKGFGLAQWTYWSRKADLYDFWKASGKKIDSAELQVDFAIKELKESYNALYTFLKSTKDVFTATSRICREYERPAFNNIDARFSSAKRIQNEINLKEWNKDEPEPAPSVDHSLQLRTIDKNCSGFDEIYLLTALLVCRGYSANSGLVSIDKIWTDALGKAVKEFQSDYGLSADGIVGQKTWQKLMERG